MNDNVITIKMWKDITAFEPIVGDKLDVDGTVKRIAEVRGKSIEEVENMAMEDLLPEFIECVHLVNNTVFNKISKLPKNGSGDNE